jgi:hypothetical protein
VNSMYHGRKSSLCASGMGKRAQRRTPPAGIASLFAVLLIAAIALLTGGQTARGAGGDGSSSIDPGWLTSTLQGTSKPDGVKNNLIDGALATRDRAVGQWHTAVLRYKRAAVKAHKAHGKRRRKLSRRARALAPDPLAKPEYTIVWSSHANGSDESGGSGTADLTSLLGNPESWPSDADARFIPGLDGFQVIDARKRNLDGSPNGDYAKIVNFVQLPLPWGIEAEAHHMQYQWENGQPILAGGLFNDTTFVLGTDDVPNLELRNTLTPQDTPSGSVPDAYDYAGNGRFVGTYMGGPNYNFAGSPGEAVTLKPDAQKGLVISSETAGGAVDGRDTGNAGGVPEPCNEDEAAPLNTCANPHGVQVRPDLGRMITSDYGEPKMVVLDPAKTDGGRFFRPTVRIWDTHDPDAPKLVSVAHMPKGWRPPNPTNTMHDNRGIMEAAKTFPRTPQFPSTLVSNGVFAGAMCGGGVFFTPDITQLKGDSSRRFNEVFDDGIALVAARRGTVDDFLENAGSCEGGAWMQVSRNNRRMFRVVGGNAPNIDNTTGRTQPVKILYDIDIQRLVESAQDGEIRCDLTRGTDVNGDGVIDLKPRQVVQRIAEGKRVADCPRLLSTLVVDDKTTGGPHWAAIDNHSITADGYPTRLVFSDYFVARSGVDGNHRLYLVNVNPRTGRLSYDRTFRDEHTGQLGFDFNRRDWPGNAGAGYYKPHSMVWVCPPGVCPSDSPGVGIPRAIPPKRTSAGNGLAPGAREDTDATFAGDCTMTGTSYFQKPYTLAQGYNGYEAEARGTCKGKVGGKPYDGPVDMYFDGRMNQPMSCELGLPVSVPSTLTFGSPGSVNATRVNLIMRLAARPVTEMPFVFTGAFNGRGYGKLSYSRHVDQNTAIQCASGPGLLSLDFDLELHTIDTVSG